MYEILQLLPRASNFFFNNFLPQFCMVRIKGKLWESLKFCWPQELAWTVYFRSGIVCNQSRCLNDKRPCSTPTKYSIIKMNFLNNITYVTYIQDVTLVLLRISYIDFYDLEHKSIPAWFYLVCLGWTPKYNADRKL